MNLTLTNLNKDEHAQLRDALILIRKRSTENKGHVIEIDYVVSVDDDESSKNDIEKLTVLLRMVRLKNISVVVNIFVSKIDITHLRWMLQCDKILFYVQPKSVSFIYKERDFSLTVNDLVKILEKDYEWDIDIRHYDLREIVAAIKSSPGCLNGAQLIKSCAIAETFCQTK